MGNLIAGNRYMQVSDAGTMWDGFKIGIPGLYNKYDNDFHQWTADEWTITEVDVGAGATTQNLLDVANGVLSLISAGNENDGNNLQLGGTGDDETTGEGFAPVAGKNIYFETRVRSSLVTQHDFFLGLHVEDTTIVAGRGTDYIGFRTDDGDTALDIECSAGSSASDITSVATLANSTWIKLGFKVTGTTKVDFWIDDTLTNTISSDIPTALMKLSIAQLSGAAAATELDVDFVRIYQEV